MKAQIKGNKSMKMLTNRIRDNLIIKTSSYVFIENLHHWQAPKAAAKKPIETKIRIPHIETN
jgi:hypothetical protein